MIANELEDQVYARMPIRTTNGIPVFSESNAYTENYEQISADHLQSMQANGENPFIPEKLWVEFEDSTLTLVQKHAQEGDSILDVGVGLGRLLERLPHLKRYGVDISMGYLEVAQRKGIEVSYALIEELPYRENSFDILVCTDVLEHVLDLNRCCANMLSVLRPEGKLIVRVPYREELWPYLSEDLPYQYVHVRNFDEHSLRLLFERIFDCHVVEVSTAGYLRSSTRLRYGLPWSGWPDFVDRGLALLEHRLPGFYLKLLTSLYRPIAINVVVSRT